MSLRWLLEVPLACRQSELQSRWWMLLMETRRSGDRGSDCNGERCWSRCLSDGSDGCWCALCFLPLLAFYDFCQDRPVAKESSSSSASWKMLGEWRSGSIGVGAQCSSGTEEGMVVTGEGKAISGTAQYGVGSAVVAGGKSSLDGAGTLAILGGVQRRKRPRPAGYEKLLY